MRSVAQKYPTSAVLLNFKKMATIFCSYTKCQTKTEREKFLFLTFDGWVCVFLELQKLIYMYSIFDTYVTFGGSNLMGMGFPWGWGLNSGLENALGWSICLQTILLPYN